MMATGPKSSKTATNEYRISIEGNPYPHALALVNPAGDNLNIKRHGFTGPLGQLLSLKYTVYDDANEKLFTVVDGGFSNMPRVALIIEHKEVAVFDYGLNRLEMKCVTNIPNYTKKVTSYLEITIYSVNGKWSYLQLTSFNVINNRALTYRFWIKPN